MDNHLFRLMYFFLGFCRSVMSQTPAPVTTPPVWFLRQLNICHQFFAEGDPTQCNHGNAHTWQRENCNATNIGTAPYFDATNNKYGGCQMQWKFQLLYNQADAAAFLGGQMCFQYQATGDPKQCSYDGKYSDTLCSGNNQYPPFYVDDTDKRPGGCIMRWMFKTTPGVPLAPWTKNVSFCLVWRDASGGHQQCSGQTPKLCAPLNEWTPDYLDDTDIDSQGCMMSWGFFTS